MQSSQVLEVHFQAESKKPKASVVQAVGMVQCSFSGESETLLVTHLLICNTDSGQPLLEWDIFAANRRMKVKMMKAPFGMGPL